MAHDSIIKRNPAELTGKVDSIRTMLRSLIDDISHFSQPVVIDPIKGTDFYEDVTKFEKRLIVAALEISGGRQNHAARLLNLKKSTLCTKIKQLTIKTSPAAFRQQPE